jgi:hypothetical protein
MAGRYVNAVVDDLDSLITLVSLNPSDDNLYYQMLTRSRDYLTKSAGDALATAYENTNSRVFLDLAYQFYDQLTREQIGRIFYDIGRGDEE